MFKKIIKHLLRSLLDSKSHRHYSSSDYHHRGRRGGHDSRGYRSYKRRKGSSSYFSS